jgi:hypothetical protein
LDKLAFSVLAAGAIYRWKRAHSRADVAPSTAQGVIIRKRVGANGSRERAPDDRL